MKLLKIVLKNMVSYIKGGIQTKGIWKQDPEANILAQKGWEWGVEKAQDRNYWRALVNVALVIDYISFFFFFFFNSHYNFNYSNKCFTSGSLFLLQTRTPNTFVLHLLIDSLVGTSHFSVVNSSSSVQFLCRCPAQFSYLTLIVFLYILVCHIVLYDLSCAKSHFILWVHKSFSNTSTFPPSFYIISKFHLDNTNIGFRVLFTLSSHIILELIYLFFPPSFHLTVAVFVL